MTRRRYLHCRNTKCNRRLEELVDRPDDPQEEKLCDACLEMEAAGAATGFEAGFASGRQSGILWIGGIVLAFASILAFAMYRNGVHF